MNIFEILNASVFQICLWLFCAIILSKVLINFVNLGEIFECSFEVFGNRKLLILTNVANAKLLSNDVSILNCSFHHSKDTLYRKIFFQKVLDFILQSIL